MFVFGNSTTKKSDEIKNISENMILSWCVTQNHCVKQLLFFYAKQLRKLAITAPKWIIVFWFITKTENRFNFPNNTKVFAYFIRFRRTKLAYETTIFRPQFSWNFDNLSIIRFHSQYNPLTTLWFFLEQTSHEKYQILRSFTEFSFQDNGWAKVQ